MALAPQAWSTVTWREGGNNEFRGRFTVLRVRPAHRDYLGTEMCHEEWLLIEWPEGEAEPAKYFLTIAPEEATWEQMVFANKIRWRIERDYQDLKQDFGLGHYEGWGGCGFHHHATLSIATYAFLMAQHLKVGRSGAGGKKASPNGRLLPSQGLCPSGTSSAQRHRTQSRRCACASRSQVPWGTARIASG